jgi:hypothetical protein
MPKTKNGANRADQSEGVGGEFSSYQQFLNQLNSSDAHGNMPIFIPNQYWDALDESTLSDWRASKLKHRINPKVTDETLEYLYKVMGFGDQWVQDNFISTSLKLYNRGYECTTILHEHEGKEGRDLMMCMADCLRGMVGISDIARTPAYFWVNMIAFYQDSIPAVASAPEGICAELKGENAISLVDSLHHRNSARKFVLDMRIIYERYIKAYTFMANKLHKQVNHTLPRLDVKASEITCGAGVGAKPRLVDDTQGYERYKVYIECEKDFDDDPEASRGQVDEAGRQKAHSSSIAREPIKLKFSVPGSLPDFWKDFLQGISAPDTPSDSADTVSKRKRS